MEAVEPNPDAPSRPSPSGGLHPPSPHGPEAQLRREFADPANEGRRLFSEWLGTFFLVLVGAGGHMLRIKTGEVARAAEVTAPGLMVGAVILFMGRVGGAHLNPVVSIAFAMRRDFPWRRVPGYIVVQVVGAVSAVLFLWAVLGKVGMLGATEPGPGFSDWQALLIEVVLTLGLVSVILGTASTAQNVGHLSAVAVAGYIVLAGLWAGPVSGASMNPARSLGPDLLRGDLGHSWVYIVGPLAGALLAVGCAALLRGGAGHDDAAARAAQGGL